MDVQQDQLEQPLAQAALAADRKFELLSEIEQHPGFLALKPWQQEEFRQVVSQLTVGRDLLGGWRAISELLGVRKSQTWERISLWQRVGLISESNGPRNEYGAKGKHTFRPGVWTLLPDHVSSEQSERMKA